MKKNFTLIIALSCFYLSMAQPAMNTMTTPVIGSTVSVLSKTDNTVDPGAAGASKVWDFSGVSFTGIAPTTSTVMNPSATPYAAKFPNANYAEKSAAGDYSYFGFTTTSETLYGMHDAAQNVDVVYTDPIKVIQLPIAFNGTMSDNFSGSYTANSIPVTVTGTMNVVYDGYGTLKTSQGTYNNIVRMKATKVDNTEFNMDMGEMGDYSYTVTTTSVTYSWMVPGSSSPLFAIVDITISSTMGGSSSSRTAMLYNAAPTGVESLALQNLDIAAGPNPAAESVTIDFRDLSADDYTISLTNEHGMVVYEQKLFAGAGERHEIHTGSLIAGVYALRVSSATGGKTMKIVKL